MKPSRVDIDPRTLRAIDLVGDRWGLLLLVVLDDTDGARFSDIVTKLALSRRVLTERLKELVEAGLVRTEQYSERPPRSHYLLTPRGVQARRLAMALVHVAGGGQLNAAEVVLEAASASEAASLDAEARHTEAEAAGSGGEAGPFRDIKPAPYLVPGADRHPSDHLLERDLDYAWTIYQQSVLAIVRYDDQYGTDFVATVQAYLECDASISATAERLFAHRHTVRYRLDRVQELVGLDVDIVADRERLQLGLRAMVMFHRMGRSLL